MYYYLLHELSTHLFTTLPNGKRNVRVFFIGSLLHFITYLFAQSYPSLFMLANFYFLFWLIDAITMAIIYKLYYSRSIFAEIDDYSTEKWKYNSEKDTYEPITRNSVETHPL